MVDPDAPYADNPGCQSWLHWIVVNIDVRDITTNFPSFVNNFCIVKILSKNHLFVFIILY